MTWQQGDDATRSARLELVLGGLAFEGTGANGVAEETIQFADLLDVRVGRSASDRISGRHTLVLERRTGQPIRIASIVHPGVVSELAEHLASQLGKAHAMSRAVVVLPLPRGCERAGG